VGNEVVKTFVNGNLGKPNEQELTRWESRQTSVEGLKKEKKGTESPNFTTMQNRDGPRRRRRTKAWAGRKVPWLIGEKRRERMPEVDRREKNRTGFRSTMRSGGIQN